MAVRDRIET